MSWSVHCANRSEAPASRSIPLRPAAVLTVDQLAAEAPQRLVLREQGNSSIFNVECRLQSTSAGTRFTQSSEFSWKGLPAFAQRLLALGVRRDVRRQLRDLKRVLEAP